MISSCVSPQLFQQHLHHFYPPSAAPSQGSGLHLSPHSTSTLTASTPCDGRCELRIGVYESFDTLCIYLESNGFGSQDASQNFWVKYRIAVENQKDPRYDSRCVIGGEFSG
jgi:hypothetical protein